MRNRARFAAAYGFMVAVPDAPPDRPSLTRFRSSAEHAEDVRTLIVALRELAPAAPVWVIGTSMGTVSFANAGARPSREGGPDGVVLTSSITRWNRGEGEAISASTRRSSRPSPTGSSTRRGRCRRVAAPML